MRCCYSAVHSEACYQWIRLLLWHKDKKEGGGHPAENIFSTLENSAQHNWVTKMW